MYLERNEAKYLQGGLLMERLQWEEKFEGQACKVTKNDRSGTGRNILGSMDILRS